jgi:hypothetical protein
MPNYVPEFGDLGGLLINQAGGLLGGLNEASNPYADLQSLRAAQQDINRIRRENYSMLLGREWTEKELSKMNANKSKSIFQQLRDEVDEWLSDIF